MTSRPKNRVAAALREFALQYPEAREDFPWGERVAKVRDKVFVFLGRDDEDLGVTVKLPSSGLMALGLPFASPTGYGLGKSGWVTARFGPGDKPPVELFAAVDRRELPRGGAEGAGAGAAGRGPEAKAAPHPISKAAVAQRARAA
jgi:predicted DNA-binding protein (MmcQ/YjbR family)